MPIFVNRCMGKHLCPSFPICPSFLAGGFKYFVSELRWASSIASSSTEVGPRDAVVFTGEDDVFLVPSGISVRQGKRISRGEGLVTHLGQGIRALISPLTLVSLRVLNGDTKLASCLLQALSCGSCSRTSAMQR